MESESGHSPEGGRPPKAPRTGSRPGSPSGVDAPEATAALAYQQYGLHPSELSAHRQDTEKGVGGVDAQEGLRRQLALRAAKDAEEDRLKLAETQPLNLLSAALSAAPGYDAEILAAANSARMDSDTTAPLNADANARARSTFRALLTVSRTDEATFQAAHNSLYKIAGDECISCVVPSSANESPLILSLARSDDHRDVRQLPRRAPLPPTLPSTQVHPFISTPTPAVAAPPEAQGEGQRAIPVRGGRVRPRGRVRRVRHAVPTRCSPRELGQLRWVVTRA